MPTWVSSGLCGSTRAKRYCNRYTVTARVLMRLWRSDSCATHILNRRDASSNAADARARAPPPPPPYRVPAAAVARAMMVVRVTRHSGPPDPCWDRTTHAARFVRHEICRHGFHRRDLRLPDPCCMAIGISEAQWAKDAMPSYTAVR